jgi:hypothetical protein
MLQVLTPTGDRPEAWELCQRWMQRQTYTGPVRWLVVDDGKVEMSSFFKRDGYQFEKYRLKPMNQNTQARNLLFLLGKIDYSLPVVCWEDDDYYAPGWLDRVDKELDEHDLVGQGWNCYYHVKTGAIRINDNDKHASLCASAFKGGALKVFRTQCERGPRLIDAALWRHCSRRHVFNARLVIGMKGLPGRAGIAGGHNLEGEPFDLSEWIGDDARAYAQFR